jgi:hypothetical protein
VRQKAWSRGYHHWSTDSGPTHVFGRVRKVTVWSDSTHMPVPDARRVRGYVQPGLSGTGWLELEVLFMLWTILVIVVIVVLVLVVLGRR